MTVTATPVAASRGDNAASHVYVIPVVRELLASTAANRMSRLVLSRFASGTSLQQ